MASDLLVWGAAYGGGRGVVGCLGCAIVWCAVRGGGNICQIAFLDTPYGGSTANFNLCPRNCTVSSVHLHKGQLMPHYLNEMMLGESIQPKADWYGALVTCHKV